MKTIGILGGLGPESTISYYAYITREYYERRKDYAYPNIVIYSLSFQRIIDAGYAKPDLVRGAIASLHAAGADFVVASCNSIHVVYEELLASLPIPWISIMAAAAEQIRAKGLNKVGLLGTAVTMGQGFYQKALRTEGIDVLTPPPDEQARINEIIFGELVRGEVHGSSRAYVLRCIDGLMRNGAQGIVLGCTELPFLIEQKHTTLPVFDTTTIHARKALDLAMESEAG